MKGIKKIVSLVSLLLEINEESGESMLMYEMCINDLGEKDSLKENFKWNLKTRFEKLLINTALGAIISPVVIALMKDFGLSDTWLIFSDIITDYMIKIL